MLKPLYVGLGLLATALAIAGAILPGLPTTPFVLVAVWAFARSSPARTAWLHRIPLLRTALLEADRFERKRAIRPAIKLVALASAWGSFALTAVLAGRLTSPMPLGVGAAALAATAFMLWIPTDWEG